ncbi:MAG: hypothetical protein ACLVG9_01615 [Eubacteriales bacterium]|jgi:hypothetical protein
MKKYENECVDCGRPCMGNICPNRNVLRFYCDKCREEAQLYHYKGKELCIDCIEDDLAKVAE